MMKRSAAVLLVLCLLCMTLSVSASWAGMEYAGMNDGANALRAELENRNSYISISLLLPADSNTELAGRQLMDLATAHTGIPSQGDYLRQHVSGYDVSGSYTQDALGIHLTLNYSLRYASTADQEAALASAVNNALAQMNLSGRSEYEKARAICEYICANVRYDYDHVQLGESYPLQFTAYAALCQGSAVCQGFTSLFYRMALAAGLDARCIPSLDSARHVWNMVRIDGVWYDLDVTYDAQSFGSLQNFLLCDSDFMNCDAHLPNAEGQMIRSGLNLAASSYGIGYSAFVG